jgi:hypothetical protein
MSPGSGGLVISDVTNGIATSNQAYSVDLFVNPDALEGCLVMISSDPHASNGYVWPLLGFADGGSLVAQNLTADIGNTGSYQTVTDPTPLPVGTWSHVAMTWSAANGTRLYVDGAQIMVTPVGQGNSYYGPTGSSYLFIGTLANGLDYYTWWNDIDPLPFSGSIDEVKVFARELQPSEVAQEAAR